MNYMIIVESDIGRFFEEKFEEVSGHTIRERVNEIFTEGYKHSDITGNYQIAPSYIKTIKISKIG